MNRMRFDGDSEYVGGSGLRWQLLDQDKCWLPRSGKMVALEAMTFDHKVNLVKFLFRHAASYQHWYVHLAMQRTMVDNVWGGVQGKTELLRLRGGALQAAVATVLLEETPEAFLLRMPLVARLLTLIREEAASWEPTWRYEVDLVRGVMTKSRPILKGEEVDGVSMMPGDTLVIQWKGTF